MRWASRENSAAEVEGIENPLDVRRESIVSAGEGAIAAESPLAYCAIEAGRRPTDWCC